MSGVCSHCGCADIDIDQARGDAVCTACGSVLEDQRIVSEVQFQEAASGAASVVGQFVGTDGVKEPSLGSSFQHGFGRESKAETLQKAKRRIQNLSCILKLNQHCIDTAMNFFKMAYLKKLTRTRRSTHVIAACVYLVCRTEGLPHMLLDISDALQVNVYTLGKTYLVLSRHLCINIPAIDPCLYIPRFAHRLEFGEKTHEVSMTALRLVQRMKRDWMGTGRRPSGLCGSALLVAARMHDFSRSTKDIIKVVKVCENTIKKRLNEFGATASSNLTIDEFQRIDLETEHDPPAFIEGKKKAKQNFIDDPNKLSHYTSEVGVLQEEIEKSLTMTSKHQRLQHFNSDTLEESEALSVAHNMTHLSADTSCVVPDTTHSSVDVSGLENDEMAHILSDSDVIVQGPRPSAASLGIHASVMQCLTAADSTPVGEADGELDLTGIDDAELDKFILTEEESIVKTQIWMQENGEFIRLMEEKADKQAKEAEENPKKKKKPRKSKAPIQAKSANEAIEQMLQQKRISNKINYDVLKDLNKDAALSALGQLASPTQSSTLDSTRLNKASSVSISKTLSSTRSLKRPNITTEKASIKRPKSEKSDESESTTPATVLVESGPVEYALDDDGIDEDIDEDDEEQLVGATELFGNMQYGEEYDNDVMDDDYE